ncbi:zinc ABC transporter substrate-binding protein [Myxococcota bacterium]|nr:zinc ABC transporter substrate-binding protein [Myxococcota bacterium]
MRRLLAVAATLLGLVAIAWGLGSLQHAIPLPATGGPWPVVATTTIAADLARQVGGDRVLVEALMGPGVDPHQYRAREGDLGRILGARLVVYHGLHLEGRMTHVLESLSRLGVPAIALGEALPKDQILRHGEAPDPHVWMDVGLFAQAVPALVEAFSRIDPAGAEEYRQRGQDAARRLGELDDWVRNQVRSIPPGQRLLVTAHDAFAYFGRAYGMDVRGVQGLSTVTEAGARDIGLLAEEVARRRVASLFVETSLSPRLVEAVVRSAAAMGHEVSLGGSLFSDSLGTPGTPEGTYEGMIRANVRTLVEGLGPGATDRRGRGIVDPEHSEGL